MTPQRGTMNVVHSLCADGITGSLPSDARTASNVVAQTHSCFSPASTTGMELEVQTEQASSRYRMPSRQRCRVAHCQVVVLDGVRGDISPRVNVYGRALCKNLNPLRTLQTEEMTPQQRVAMNHCGLPWHTVTPMCWSPLPSESSSAARNR